jgi:hypothetical protein
VTRRIDPEAALRPVRSDPLALLIVWFVRKSFYWVLFLGVLIAAALNRVDEVGDTFDSAGTAAQRLASPLAAIVVALLLRFGSSFAALVLAYPLARDYERGLAPRTNVGKSIGTLLDRLKVARAYRSLRWTHHVRQAAVVRLGRTGRRLSRLDPILDVLNIGMFVAAFAMLVLAVGDGS